MTVGIGVVGIIIAYMTYRAMTGQGGTTTDTGTPTAVTDQGTTPVDTNAGGSADYTSAIQGLTSAEQQMAQSLQTFYSQYSAAQGASATDNGSGPAVTPVPNATGTSTNLSTLLAYLRSVGLGNAHVTHVGTGTQSGYLISGVSGINESQLLQHYGAGWSITQSGGQYLLKGPRATKVHISGGKVVT